MRSRNKGRTCSVEGCGGKAHSKEMCAAHYNRGRYVPVERRPKRPGKWRVEVRDRDSGVLLEEHDWMTQKEARAMMTAFFSGDLNVNKFPWETIALVVRNECATCPGEHVHERVSEVGHESAWARTFDRMEDPAPLPRGGKTQ